MQLRTDSVLPGGIPNKSGVWLTRPVPDWMDMISWHKNVDLISVYVHLRQFYFLGGGEVDGLEVLKIDTRPHFWIQICVNVGSSLH